MRLRRRIRRARTAEARPRGFAGGHSGCCGVASSRMERKESRGIRAGSARTIPPTDCPITIRSVIAGGAQSGRAAASSWPRPRPRRRGSEAKGDVRHTLHRRPCRFIEGASKPRLVPAFTRPHRPSSATSNPAPAAWATFYDHRGKEGCSAANAADRLLHPPRRRGWNSESRTKAAGARRWGEGALCSQPYVNGTGGLVETGPAYRTDWLRRMT